MKMEFIVRFDYGSTVPWVQHVTGGIMATAGPNSLRLATPVELRGENLTTVAEFTVAEGQRVPFMLNWMPSHKAHPPVLDAGQAVLETAAWWQLWSARCTYRGPHRDAVLRSLITLKGLTYLPTGGIVAAATTSLPEQLGGVRNWDYRYCWLRDATFTLLSLTNAGYQDEARAWREWLLRAAAGHPAGMQIMYGVAGERRLTEFEIPWLPGYDDSRPVRVGNAASEQFQLDVYGEVIDAMYQARRFGLDPLPVAWKVGGVVIDFVRSVWREPDEGIWEVRGPRRNFTHSKVMAWVALDRAVKAVENYHLDGPLERWQKTRDAIHAEVCDKGFDPGQNAFVQYFGGKELDASLLMVPLVGFLPPEDPRVRGTLEAIEKNLMQEGFVARYSTGSGVDGLPAGEGAFLLCTFWLADNLYLVGRREEAREVFERLLGLCNDVGLLSEEYDPKARRLVGNFPQAFTHVGLVSTALTLARGHTGPAEHRKEG
jgi:GH15 family glucan-1,4-alpha-glucosidase